MDLANWLSDATRKLSAAGVATARLDALVLLEDELNTNRTHLLAHPEMELTPENIKVLAGQVARRAQHEPLAYIRGKTEFYGREFIISPAVLEPRPESETMIDLLKKLIASNRAAVPRHPKLDLGSSQKESGEAAPFPLDFSLGGSGMVRIADVGTGSGALGITAKLELPNTVVDLLEIDPEAIKIAQKNVIKFTTYQTVLQSDLLSTTLSSYHILLCNLPYIPDGHTINPAAMHEPKWAIFGGENGLDIYRQLFDQVKHLQKRPLLILSESLPPQHQTLAAIAEQADYVQQAEDDFIQAFALKS